MLVFRWHKVPETPVDVAGSRTICTLGPSVLLFDEISKGFGFLIIMMAIVICSQISMLETIEGKWDAAAA